MLIVKDRSNDDPSRSVARTRTEYRFLVSKSNTRAVRSWDPMIVNDPLSPLPAPVTRRNVCRSPASGSVADRAPTLVPTGRFSATRAGVSEIPVGGSFCTTTSQPVPTRSVMSAMARSPAPSPQDTTSTNPAPSRAFSTSPPGHH